MKADADALNARVAKCQTLQGPAASECFQAVAAAMTKNDKAMQTNLTNLNELQLQIEPILYPDSGCGVIEYRPVEVTRELPATECELRARESEALTRQKDLLVREKDLQAQATPRPEEVQNLQRELASVQQDLKRIREDLALMQRASITIKERQNQASAFTQTLCFHSTRVRVITGKQKRFAPTANLAPVRSVGVTLEGYPPEYIRGLANKIDHCAIQKLVNR